MCDCSFRSAFVSVRVCRRDGLDVDLEHGSAREEYRLSALRTNWVGMAGASWVGRF